MDKDTEYLLFLLSVFLLGFVSGGAISSTVNSYLESKRRQRDE